MRIAGGSLSLDKLVPLIDFDDQRVDGCGIGQLVRGALRDAGARSTPHGRHGFPATRIALRIKGWW
jgi:hypothetical protein